MSRVTPQHTPHMTRAFNFTVTNALGDEFTVPMNVRLERSPANYYGPAIIRALRGGMPPEKPYRVSADEVAS